MWTPTLWAAWIKRTPLMVSHAGRHFKSSLLTYLENIPARREPLLRGEISYSGLRFHERIRAEKANVESVIIQTVGHVLDQECVSCQKKNGPFEKCVVLSGADNLITACANCHWNGQGRRCTFYRAPASTAVEKPATTFHKCQRIY